MTGRFATFTTTYSGTLIKVPVRPGTAVAWQRMAQPTPFAYFIIADVAGQLCPAQQNCLDALGLDLESQSADVYPSIEDMTAAPARLTSPDWFPVNTQYATDVVTTVQSCTSGGCANTGLMLTIVSPVTFAGAYQAVYSPNGGHIAYVRSTKTGPQIYTIIDPRVGRGLAHGLTAGTEPDWQPVAPFPPA